MISLVYLLLYLVDGDLIFLFKEGDAKKTQKEEFAYIRKMKNSIKIDELAGCSEEAQRLIPFIEDIFKIRFDQEPNYDKLKFHLIKILLDLNETPNKIYDWNKDQKIVEKPQKHEEEKI